VTHGRSAWASSSLAARLAVVRRFRHLLADEAPAFAEAASGLLGSPMGEGLVAEVLPLADACRFLEREAAALLAPRRLGGSGRPAWLFGVDLEIHRERLGTVLIIGAHNYPLLLVGVQVIQALVAGNDVIVKPGRGGAPAALALAGGLRRAGVPEGALAVLDDGEAAGLSAIDAGVDKVVLTGSAATGRAVLSALATHGTPAVMELSGCDACLVLDGADLDLVARALAFGLRFKGSATCVAPRRVFARAEALAILESKLVLAARTIAPRCAAASVASRVKVLVDDAVSRGARVPTGAPDGGTLMPVVVVGDARVDMPLLREDLFAPIVSLVPVSGVDDAVDSANACPYALGASVFGPEAAAREVASRLDVGCVQINDVIASTADPRLPFGGRRASGFGVTRGAEGLLDMTAIKAVSTRRGRMLQHLDAPRPGDQAIFLGYLRAAHAGSWRARARAFFDLAAALVRRGRPSATGRKDRTE